MQRVKTPSLQDPLALRGRGFYPSPFLDRIKGRLTCSDLRVSYNEAVRTEGYISHPSKDLS